MAEHIAVCMNDNGVTSSLYDASAIVIYQKELGNWDILREKKFSLDKQGGMVGMRRQMAELIPFLEQCKVFVGESVVGVPYFELEKMQCSIWEFEGEPLSFLDYVLEQEESKAQENAVQGSNAVPVPVERENGVYYISIKEIQENSGGITSKQVLLPFLRQGKFYSLEVLCNHIPPWLEAELSVGNLIGRVEKLAPTETHVYIGKRGCET
ncbi:Fe-only nitrogenase accessory AnfO family protein [Pelosinus sp. UFO1]|uniref:Fe-only nitrogenase accessory AnfO family protein n=1 Tax=Pelosinus sp. UFO1 TaxID=484770 RepID=UPI0004D0CC6F|nr:Fe-only nitrogenase accessory AnfO family protein [Pelosinus sp. UFO1]AIF49602.1 Nitrogenase iron-iron accessory protein AnfO [Pelosinus sp. UFO1]